MRISKHRLLGFSAPTIVALVLFSTSATAMECVAIMSWPDRPLWRCLGIPPAPHPWAYWQGIGMTVLGAPGFLPCDPITRVRCGGGCAGNRYLVWQTYVTVPSGAVPNVSNTTALTTDIKWFSKVECFCGPLP